MSESSFKGIGYENISRSQQLWTSRYKYNSNKIEIRIHKVTIFN